MADAKTVVDPRAGAEIVTDPEECMRRTLELLDEIGFPRGIIPLKELVECGQVKETGFVWMRSKKPTEHHFKEIDTLVSYKEEVTCYVEKYKMTKMTGIKTKQAFFWVAVTEMTIKGPSSRKIYFNTSLGVGKYFPIVAFMTAEEKEKKKYMLEAGTSKEEEEEEEEVVVKEAKEKDLSEKKEVQAMIV